MRAGSLQHPSVGVGLGAQRGFAYLGLLLAVALIGAGLLAASEVWVTQFRREKLAQLDWVGEQFVRAIGSYYESSPGSVKVYPANLNELLEDRRWVTLRRHLRMIYLNPFTGKADWELVMGADARVRGVRVTVPGQAGSEVREYVRQQ